MCLKYSSKSLSARLGLPSCIPAYWLRFGVPVIFFGDKSLIRIQFLGPAKMLVGVTEAGWDLPESVYQKLAIYMGLSFKDVCTSEFLTSAEKRMPVPERWNVDKVSTLYALNVPPLVG